VKIKDFVGPVQPSAPSDEVIENARAEGISKRVLTDARGELGVESFKREFPRTWWMQLPQRAQNEEILRPSTNHNVESDLAEERNQS
jgi:hypothetical protein